MPLTASVGPAVLGVFAAGPGETAAVAVEGEGAGDVAGAADAVTAGGIDGEAPGAGLIAGAA